MAFNDLMDALISTNDVKIQMCGAGAGVIVACVVGMVYVMVYPGIEC